MAKSGRRNKKLLRRLKKYGIAATAVGVSLGPFLEKSEAGIVQFTGPIGDGTGPIKFDATSSAAATGFGSILDPYDFGVNVTNYIGFINRRTGGNATNTGALAPGTVIDSSTSFGINFGYLGGSNVLFGFRVTGEPGVASPIFGWAEISISMNGATLENWAFEDSGAGILAGGAAIPEPSQLAMLSATLAMACGGLAAIKHRRRRRAAETDAVAS